jgi:signal transduction histidine kinase/ActR/RegA family two-component response regulator
MSLARLFRRRWSLGSHLTWVVLLALLPALGIQYASNLERRQEAKVHAQETLQQLVNDLARQQEQVTTSARQMLTALSLLPDLRRRDAAALNPLLAALQKEDPRFSNVFVMDSEGDIFASALPTSTRSMKDRLYFREALVTRGFTVGEFVISRVSGTRAIHFSLPVFDEQGGLLAVLGAAYNLGHYSQLFNASALPPGTSLNVLDHAGTVLHQLAPPTTAGGSLVGAKLPDDQLQQVLGSTPEGTYWTSPRAGEATLLAFHQLRASSQAKPYLSIQVGQSESQVLQESRRVFRRYLLLLLVTVASAVVVARIMGNRVITTPIRQLVHASRRIGRGSLAHRPGLGFTFASQEVAQLGDELRRTSQALARREEEQRKTEESLRNTQRIESLGVLAGGIAHDFNNLLAAVLGNLNLAQMRLEPDNPAQRPLGQAEKAVHRATELTRQMLAYSGRSHFVVKPLNLNLTVQEMSHLLHVTLSKKTTLKLDLAPELPPVMADVAQLQQVVLNLVTNAAEAIGTQEGTISLRTHAKDLEGSALEALCPNQGLEAGPYAILEVTDTGCGMEPEVLERIFDPFYTTKLTGHGLGLSAMHGILKIHRAGIHIQSEPDAGTTFKILFPATEETLPGALNVGFGPKQTFQGLALVADDEPMVLEFAAAALESMGFDVILARDGAEAVARFQENPEGIRLAILDLTMPRMDGLEAFAELRRLRPALPVILSSGYDADATAHRLMDQGQAWFLPKPYPMSEFRRVVCKAMASAEAAFTAPGSSSPGA